MQQVDDRYDFPGHSRGARSRRPVNRIPHRLIVLLLLLAFTSPWWLPRLALDGVVNDNDNDKNGHVAVAEKNDSPDDEANAHNERESPARTLQGRVVQVLDGDSILVSDVSRKVHTVRLKDIDAPERGQAFGNAARRALMQKVYREHVQVEWSERDKYDRILGHVMLGERHINLELIRDGFAWHYDYEDKDGALSQAEAAARESRRGLWSDADPQSPWDYRREHPR